MNEAHHNSIAASGEQLVSHYLIELAGDIYAIPQSNGAALSWVQRPQQPTYLPTLPPWCLGLVNGRNTPVLLVDLRQVLGLPRSAGATDQARHVFMECDGDTVGFLVDRTHRFRLLQQPPADGELIGATVQSGNQTVRTLNLEAIWQVIADQLGRPAEDDAGTAGLTLTPA
jgi:chemotaxis signal transduction protein